MFYFQVSNIAASPLPHKWRTEHYLKKKKHCPALPFLAASRTTEAQLKKKNHAPSCLGFPFPFPPFRSRRLRSHSVDKAVPWAPHHGLAASMLTFPAASASPADRLEEQELQPFTCCSRRQAFQLASQQVALAQRAWCQSQARLHSQAALVALRPYPLLLGLPSTSTAAHLQTNENVGRYGLGYGTLMMLGVCVHSEGHQHSQCSWSTLSTSMINTMSKINSQCHWCLWSTLSINVSEQNSMSMINTVNVYGHQCLWSTSMSIATYDQHHQCLWSKITDQHHQRQDQQLQWLQSSMSLITPQCLWSTPSMSTVNTNHDTMIKTQQLHQVLQVGLTEHNWKDPCRHH